MSIPFNKCFSLVYTLLFPFGRIWCVDPGAHPQLQWSAHHFFFLFPVCKVSVWAGNHKFSSSVMSGSFKSMFGVLHRLDLGLMSHPNDIFLVLIWSLRCFFYALLIMYISQKLFYTKSKAVFKDQQNIS